MLLNDKNNIVKLTMISIMLAVISSGCYERTSSDYYAYQGPVMMAEFESSENELSVQSFLTAYFEEFVLNHRMAAHDVYEIKNEGMQDISLKGCRNVFRLFELETTAIYNEAAFLLTHINRLWMEYPAAVLRSFG